MSEPNSIADELRKLHELKEKGAITDEEFAEQKERLLRQTKTQLGSTSQSGDQPQIVITQSRPSGAGGLVGCVVAIVVAVVLVFLLLAIGGYFWFSAQKTNESAGTSGAVEQPSADTAPSDEPAETSPSPNSDEAASAADPDGTSGEADTLAQSNKLQGLWSDTGDQTDSTSGGTEGGHADAPALSPSTAGAVETIPDDFEDMCTPASDPSFDCSKAVSWSARAICGSSELRQADCRLGAAFGAIAKHADTAGLSESLRIDERLWVKRRDQVCAESAALDQCLLGWINQRVAELRRRATAADQTTLGGSAE